MTILCGPTMVVPVMKKHPCIHPVFWIDVILDREVSGCQTMVRKIALCHFLLPRRSLVKCLSSCSECCTYQQNENDFGTTIRRCCFNAGCLTTVDLTIPLIR